jgi:hypothetical protein
MQGRLIPGTSIASLPFVEAVRGKSCANIKEAIREECFSRLRGALFVGPLWTVTRNKLKIRYVLLTQHTESIHVCLSICSPRFELCGRGHELQRGACPPFH